MQSERWLIRTAENTITGPFDRREVAELVEKGKLRLNDELCSENHYWIFLHEKEEVRKQLGVEVPRSLHVNPQEATLTHTDVTDAAEPTDPGIDVRELAQAEGVPELSQSHEEVEEHTAVMSNRAFRDFRKQKKNDAQPSASAAAPATDSVTVPDAVHGPTDMGTPMPSKIRERRLPAVEQSRLVQFMTYLMMFGAIFLLAKVIRLLRQQP